MRFKGLLFVLTFIVVLVAESTGRQAQAQGLTVQVSDERAEIRFPETVTFQAILQSDTDIQEITLEYGVDMQTCGTVVAKAFPQFTPAKRVPVEWTWEMKQSGSLPPGASIWWHWIVTDASGQQGVTPDQEITWLDNKHKWQTTSGDNINLHWYEGKQDFGQELHAAAVQALNRLEQDAGLATEMPIDIYIYADYNDLGDAILYEPSWTGGVAFPENNIVIIGISPGNLDWGKRTEAHELTHVLVGHLTFSCLGDVPTWLNEGLAVYSEGTLEDYSMQQLEDAIKNDELFPVRSLSGGFSEIVDKMELSYSQSYSIVKFLIEEYGRDKMNDLLVALRDGETIDAALQQVYGFNVEGLEDAWRASIGAKPRVAGPQPTPTPQPTVVPTIRPVSGAPISVTPTPFAIPTSSSGGGGGGGSGGSGAPDSILPITLIAAVCCCLIIVAVIAGVIIYNVIRRRRRNQ